MGGGGSFVATAQVSNHHELKSGREFDTNRRPSRRRGRPQERSRILACAIEVRQIRRVTAERRHPRFDRVGDINAMRRRRRATERNEPHTAPCLTLEVGEDPRVRCVADRVK